MRRAFPRLSYGHSGLCLLLSQNASFSTSLTCLFVAMVSPPFKYIFLLLAWMFFYLCGLEPVAPRARFKCVWVFKDFSAEKPFGSQPRRHTSATELCHFKVLSRRWNQRKVQKRSKKHKTKADENGPDWIMSDLACAWLWGKSSFCLITLCLTAKWILKKKGKAQRGSLKNNSQIVTVNAAWKWCGLCTIFGHKKGSERREETYWCDCTDVGDIFWGRFGWEIIELHYAINHHSSSTVCSQSSKFYVWNSRTESPQMRSVSGFAWGAFWFQGLISLWITGVGFMWIILFVWTALKP